MEIPSKAASDAASPARARGSSPRMKTRSAGPASTIDGILPPSQGLKGLIAGRGRIPANVSTPNAHSELVNESPGDLRDLSSRLRDPRFPPPPAPPPPLARNQLLV